MVWKQRQRYTFRGIGASRTEDSLVSLRLQGGGGGDGDEERVVYHKDMWSERDYDHQGFGALMKKVNGYVFFPFFRSVIWGLGVGLMGWLA
mgnify:CR=1 FL=1